MYISSQIELTAKAVCSTCGTELDADASEKRGAVIISVEPCPSCMENAKGD